MPPVKFPSPIMSDGFRYLLTFHSPESWRETNDILRISSFTHSSTVRQYHVSSSGDESDVTEIWNWSTRGGRIRKLEPANMAQLQQLLAALPGATGEPAVERLIVVSFKDGKRWRTRSYDRASMPDPLKSIFALIESRPDLLPELLMRELQKSPAATAPSQ